MLQDRLIIAIGRIERAISRLDQYEMPVPKSNESELSGKHEALKAETRAAIKDIDAIINGGTR
jgi:hypothetical protein